MTWMDEAEVRCEAATAGPWSADEEDCYVLGADEAMISMTRGFGAEVGGHRPTGSQHANHVFIAAARTDLPHALRLLREAVALLRRAVHDDLHSDLGWMQRRDALLAAVAAGPEEAP